MNGLDNIECRYGSFFEPVADERFELVVCNPPFVVSPDTEYVFRDAGLEGDAVSRQVLQGSAAALAEGGHATVLANWARDEDSAWDAAPRAWLADRGCDILLLHFGSDEPLDYAARWNADRRGPDPEAYAAALARWMDYHRRLGIGRVANGGVIMRQRASGTPWVESFDASRSPVEGATAHVERLLAARDLSGPAPDDVLVPVPHRLLQSLRHDGDSYTVEGPTLVAEDSAGVDGAVPATAIQVLFALDGERTLGEAIRRAADATGAEEAALNAELAEPLRELYRRGLLVTQDG